MKKIGIALLCILPAVTQAQGGLGIGLKAGVNFANVANAAAISNSNRSGFLVGLFLAPTSKSILSSRTELIYSKQGYNFKSSTNTGSVNLDYIILPQLMGINITRFVQLQAGMQLAYLLNAKADSTTTSGNTGTYAAALNYYNKIDYAFAAGAEIHLVAGLLIGARYNISLGKLYKDAQSGQQPSFSTADAKNNVVQLFAGWIFGGGKKSSKK